MSNELLRASYQSMAESKSPEPWRSIQVHVGGVVAVGYGPGSEYLVVMTHSGLGVIDGRTGQTVARQAAVEQRDDPYPIWAIGIGPLANERIPLAGLWGGGLRCSAPDGWTVHRISPNWPADCAILCPPDYPDVADPSKAVMLAKDLEPPIRAIGFSDSGRSLVVANTSLYLWFRD